MIFEDSYDSSIVRQKKDNLRDTAMSKIKKYQDRQRNRELLKRQEEEAMRNRKESFVDNGRHKVKSSFGLKIFDCLAKIRREKKTGIRRKNLAFSNGIAYKYEMFPQFSNPEPKIIKKKLDNRINYNRDIKLSFDKQFMGKITEAFNGGTNEKLEYLRTKKSGLIARMGDSSDEEYDMFGGGEEKAELDAENLEFTVDKGTGNLANNIEMMNAIKTDMEAQQKLENGLKNDMVKFQDNLLQGRDFESKQDSYYMECFPQYEEVDYQASTKDGLGKREVDFESRINGQVLKKLKTAK